MNKAIFEGMSKAQKVAILKEAHDTGEPIEKIVAQTDLGTMAILDDDLKFNFKGLKITVQEWKDNYNPLGDYGKLIVIGTSETIAKYRKSKVNKLNN